MSSFNLIFSRTARLFFGTILIIVCWLPISGLAQPTAANPAGITAIHIFGDSLVDAGNVFNLSGFPPSPPYAQQFSNGPVWVTQLATSLNLNPVLSTEALPDLENNTAAPPTEGINFALGGSLSSRSNAASPNLPGLQQQIVAFRGFAQLAPPDPNTLYVVLAGGNDYNLAVSNPAAVSTLQGLPDEVTDNLIKAVSDLIDAGAQRLLVGNLPDLSGQPLTRSLNQANPQSSQQLSSLSLQHNQLLSQKLTALENASGTEIIQLDLAGLLAAVIQNPDDFDFKNVTDACLTADELEAQVGDVCENPEAFLFWDTRHPTAAGHRAIAQLALSQLVQVEEPTARSKASEPLGLLGLVGGVGIVAIMLRKRL